MSVYIYGILSTCKVLQINTPYNIADDESDDMISSAEPCESSAFEHGDFKGNTLIIKSDTIDMTTF